MYKKSFGFPFTPLTQGQSTITYFLRCAACLVILLGAYSLSAFAQVTSGTILGSVQDTSGAIVPGATITAIAPDLGITRTVTSSSNGTFSLSNLPAATYSLTVQATGFETSKKDGVILSSEIGRAHV